MGFGKKIALIMKKAMNVLKGSMIMVGIEIKKSYSLVDSDIGIEGLKKMGFVNIGSTSILSDSEIKQLQGLSSKLLMQFEQGTDEFGDYSNTVAGVGTAVIKRLPQHDPLISHSINKILSNKSVKASLNSLLGADYKIWQINLRRSSPGDKGLNLHQDSFGQMNMVILLDENLSGYGATSFLPRSHLISKTVKMLDVEVPPVLADLMRGLLKPFIGRAGDIGLFFNRTWHGRFSNSSAKTYDAIFIGFFPIDVAFRFGGLCQEDWSKEYLKEIKGTELGRLLDHGYGTDLIRDKVANQIGNAKIPFAVQIENPVVHNLKPIGWQIYMVIFLLRVIMPLGRISRRLVVAFRRYLK